MLQALAGIIILVEYLLRLGTSTDHAVVLVGWEVLTVSLANGGYWILRNSWNTTGANGYMHISYASALLERCRIFNI